MLYYFVSLAFLETAIAPTPNNRPSREVGSGTDVDEELRVILAAES